MHLNVSTEKQFAARIARFGTWLSKDALPLWLENGFDPESGGFHERLSREGAPVATDLRRARVQPRQIYCFAAAGLRGWPGKWKPAVLSSLDWFERTYRRADRLFGNVARSDGEVLDESFDLYNQAFAIFGCSFIARAFPDRAVEMEEAAGEILSVLALDYKHPLAGFHESNVPRVPLCSNPHMHLFEACLSWEEIAERPTRWSNMANEIAYLAMLKFIDQETGALREFFDVNWAPLPGDKGRVVEPGHQFEWAWLLARWGEKRGNAHAVAYARKLFQIGIEYGIDTERNIAVMALNDDFSVRDNIARLWPQTEWLKAACILARLHSGEARQVYLSAAIQACKAIEKFIDTSTAGLWHDKITSDGSVVIEPAPASSFYHIVCAILDAQDTMAALLSNDEPELENGFVAVVNAAVHQQPGAWMTGVSP